MEVATLTHQLAVLQIELARLLDTKQHRSSPWALNWKQVALALKDDVAEHQEEQKRLKAKMAATQRLLRDLRLFARQAIPSAPDATKKNWRNISLLAHPTSRAHGMTWILQQMYENADRMLSEHGFPSLPMDRDYEDVCIEFNKDGYSQLEFRSQSEILKPMDDVRATYHRLLQQHLCEWLMVDGPGVLSYTTAVETTDTTALHYMITQTGESINLLCGEFHEQDRSVFVVQQIQDDESRTQGRQRARSCWYDMRRDRPSGKWTLRILQRLSQCFTSAGHISLEEEAMYWGLDLGECPDEELKRARYRRRTLELASLLYLTSSSVMRKVAGTPK
ncbi:Aste57867_817 [Aphanomyces stellatus]|uniref:Aste57867_817 protein n=1 Tax=Aphanomyces stellatus TaxID=120398 RepID=A0A485K6U2_9STRA|nr:hypothetical protein As57867_000816 [Aphanomyces stellatus]VFT78041.1 Aste57867_817 [Aphanomyces stellatus]